MKLDTRTRNIFKKYVLNKCSREEAKEVISYFQSIKESNQLPLVEDVLDILDKKPVLNSDEADQIFSNINESIETRFEKRRNVYSFSRKYAAVVLIGILATVYCFKKDILNFSTKEVPIVSTKSILQGTDKATLTLADGSFVELDKHNAFQTQNVKSNGNEIIYKPTGNKPTEIAYNYLTIPRGGQFHIVLSDKTGVWLNSESQLKYPVTFVEGETRQVELVYGEAYFDVSPSEDNQGSKFSVLNKNQQIEVLGTEFNIRAYKDEINTYTTLVEGKVALHSNGETKNLVPNQQSNLNFKTNNLTVTTVDVYNEISWKEGVFSFENKSLKEIMKVLCRWYDTQVIFLDDSVQDEVFVGILSKDQSIEDILSIIKNFEIIKDYKIEGKTIIIE